MMINFPTYNYSVMQVDQRLIAMSGGMPILIVVAQNITNWHNEHLIIVEYRASEQDVTEKQGMSRKQPAPILHLVV